MGDQNALLGACISVVADNDVRYEGTLFSVNATESTIVLREVKVLGTEDRVVDATKIVLATEAILPFVTFPSAIIKDLWVHKPQEEPASAAPTPAPQVEEPPPPPAPAKPQAAQPIKTVPPPAPVPSHATQAPKSHQKPKPAREGPNAPVVAKQYKPVAEAVVVEASAVHPVERSQAKTTPAPTAQRSVNRRGRGGGTLPGTGSHLMRMKTRGGHGGVDADGEFDFEAGNEHFEQIEEQHKAEVAVASAVSTAYNKDDFFDSISCDFTDNEAGVRRLGGAEERKLNQETFGAVSLGFNKRGGGQPRGRGGRGRGRGRGDGSSQGDSSSQTWRTEQRGERVPHPHTHTRGGARGGAQPSTGRSYQRVRGRGDPGRGMRPRRPGSDSQPAVDVI